MISFLYKSSHFFFYIHRHPLYIKTPKNLHIYHFYRNLLYPVACRVEIFGLVSRGAQQHVGQARINAPPENASEHGGRRSPCREFTFLKIPPDCLENFSSHLKRRRWRGEVARRRADFPGLFKKRFLRRACTLFCRRVLCRHQRPADHRGRCSDSKSPRGLSRRREPDDKAGARPSLRRHPQRP